MCSLQLGAGDGGRVSAELERSFSVDSTVVRAHQHAAGARPRDRHRGLTQTTGFPPDEPPDHAIGRSRGGLTTKVHALTDELCSPQRILLSAGQAGDNPMLWPLLEAHRAKTDLTFRLLGDKAYRHNSTRTRLQTMQIEHTTPEKSDQIALRKGVLRLG